MGNVTPVESWNTLW